jgi:glycosyltransferase involved in cell wall biosynthesis
VGPRFGKSWAVHTSPEPDTLQSYGGTTRNPAGLRIRRAARTLSLEMRHNDDGLSSSADGRFLDNGSLPLIIASILREEGITGVHTHVRQLRRYLEESCIASVLVTPFSWGRLLTYPVFGFRPLVLERCSGPASVMWYRYWHEVFLRNALRRCLAELGNCVVYTQGPVEARAALRARRGPHQRVVMVVHFQTSQADEWTHKNQIKRDGLVFRAIRQFEREVIPSLDGLMYVSQSARKALLSWLPEAAIVPSAVIGNFVAPVPREPSLESLGDLVTVGNLTRAKNHRFLLEVLAVAKRAGRDLTLDVFGEGLCRKDLLQQAQSLGLEERVRLRGFQPDVCRFLPGYRAYVHASYVDAQPLAIIEAMAAGLPIIAGDVGGISELCDDGVEARFWPLEDPSQAAAILIELLDCESARFKAARAASERFHRDFDVNVVGPRLRSFLLGTPALPCGSSLLGDPKSQRLDEPRCPHHASHSRSRCESSRLTLVGKEESTIQVARLSTARDHSEGSPALATTRARFSKSAEPAAHPTISSPPSTRASPGARSKAALQSATATSSSHSVSLGLEITSVGWYVGEDRGR